VITVHLTLSSGNDLVVHLVGDFARGLGCAVSTVPVPVGSGIRIQVPDAGHALVELLTHVALAATKAGVAVTEPVCQITYQHSGVAPHVQLTLRVAEFNIDSAAASGV
jgi:hypothetical protein